MVNCKYCGERTFPKKGSPVCYNCMRTKNEDRKERRKIVTSEVELYRKDVMKRDGHKCRLCRSTENLRIDHIIPIDNGGKTEMDNLQILCRNCNSTKGKKNNKDFALDKFAYRLLESTLERLSQ